LKKSSDYPDKGRRKKTVWSLGIFVEKVLR